MNDLDQHGAMTRAYAELRRLATAPSCADRSTDPVAVDWAVRDGARAINGNRIERRPVDRQYDVEPVRIPDSERYDY